MAETEEPVVFFDGVCNLCNGAVQFILKREKSALMKFAPLQGETFAKIPGAVVLDPPDSILFLEDGILHRESAAVLRISRYLKQPWRFLGYCGYILPRFMRDALYRFIARNRYRWFGREQACYLPTPDLKKRFLS